MKTTFIDNSLFTIAVNSDIPEEYIYNYIEALAAAGIKYIELDYRMVLKMNKLPSGIGYIFRLCDPIYLDLVKAFDFNYVLVTMPNLANPLDVGNTPVIVEFPPLSCPSRHLINLAQARVSGPVSMARLCGNFPFMSEDEARKAVIKARGEFFVPVDYCPINGKKNALDTALKLACANADSITVSAGNGTHFVGIQDYIFSSMTVYSTVPKGISLPALFKAEVLAALIFGVPESGSLMDIIHRVDNEISNLINVDTGEKVKLNISLREKRFLKREYITALQHFIKDMDIPDEVAAELNLAIEHYSMSLYDTSYFDDDEPKLLN